MLRTFYFMLLTAVLHTSHAQRLVMPGDYPDPSVVRIGNTFWASATSSNWLPAYPLMKSKDLIQWETVGYVFNKLPDWADYYFWAPEINYDNGKVYMYYSAHKKGGNLCVGVASANKPEGPYTDHGPLVCQEVGSIDGFPIRDEKGKLHLVWKEDGNSVGKPTPIWYQELNEDRTALLGQKKELFRNDAPWEGNLVEGVSMIRHGDYLYAFYAAAACCGSGCNYVSGVARSKMLAGPWEKYTNNPILKNEGNWKCPGHGTPVEKDGKYYFLYHAYDTSGTIYTGRQGILKEFVFTKDNWIRFVDDVNQVSRVTLNKTDEFNGPLAHDWQWSVHHEVKKKISNGKVEIEVGSRMPLTYIGQKAIDINYEATTTIHRKKSSAGAGIGLIGDENNLVFAFVQGNQISIRQVSAGRDSLLYSKRIGRSKKIIVSMQVSNGKDVKFIYMHGGDQVKLHEKILDAGTLPPWDRALRIGLIARGERGDKATFEKFGLNTKWNN